MPQRDWRLPENKEEAFLAFYRYHLQHRSHPGMVYSFLPAIADAFELDDDQRAWLVWLNGNTQNAVTSLMLLEEAPRPQDWLKAVAFWNDNFKALEWDTDRRHQKSKFGEATEAWFMEHGGSPAIEWEAVGRQGWSETWKYAFSQPHMGRLSSWSMIEYARILLGNIVPDSDTWMFEDKSGSKSHRNGTAVVKGYDATYWDEDVPDMLGIVGELEAYADSLLAQVDHPDAGRLTMESALCTYKGFWKENRRYPNVYADMMHDRIKKAEARFGRTFDLLWETRRRDLPEHLRLEDMPYDPGLCPVKQNWFRNTGEMLNMWRDFPEIGKSEFDEKVERGEFGVRKDKKWV